MINDFLGMKKDLIINEALENMCNYNKEIFMNEDKLNTFKCSHCGGIFEKGWSDEEALKELEDNFGVTEKNKDVDILCDDCYEEFMSHF
jgi:hypothetical protein